MSLPRHRQLRQRLLRRGHQVITPAPRPVGEELRLREVHDQALDGSSGSPSVTAVQEPADEKLS